jgi:hypothetical protein
MLNEKYFPVLKLPNYVERETRLDSYSPSPFRRGGRG